jgi:hypothetical protein
MHIIYNTGNLYFYAYFFLNIGKMQIKVIVAYITLKPILQTN